MIALGVGCRRGCPASEVVAVVEAAWSQAGAALAASCLLQLQPASEFERDRTGVAHAARADVGRGGRSSRALAAVLAVPTFKSGEAGIREAAARMGLTLVVVDDAALAQAQPRCATFSAAALRSVGLASVAEAAALVAAGAGSRLVVRRVSGRRATCAIAESGAP